MMMRGQLKRKRQKNRLRRLFKRVLADVEKLTKKTTMMKEMKRTSLMAKAVTLVGNMRTKKMWLRRGKLVVMVKMKNRKF